MRKMHIKRLYALPVIILAAVLLITIMPQAAAAVKQEKDILTISGQGSVEAADLNVNKETVREIVIEDGISQIGCRREAVHSRTGSGISGKLSGLIKLSLKQESMGKRLTSRSWTAGRQYRSRRS